MMLDLPLSETAGSRSLDRLVRHSSVFSLVNAMAATREPTRIKLFHTSWTSLPSRGDTVNVDQVVS